MTKFVNNATKFGHGARILSDCVTMKVDICIAFSYSLTRVLKSLVNCRNHKKQRTTNCGVIMASNTEESSDFQKVTVLELKKYLVDRGVTVNGYNKGALAEIANSVHKMDIPCIHTMQMKQKKRETQCVCF